jgi:hypothetical protein
MPHRGMEAWKRQHRRKFRGKQRERLFDAEGDVCERDHPDHQRNGFFLNDAEPELRHGPAEDGATHSRRSQRRNPTEGHGEELCANLCVRSHLGLSKTLEHLGITIHLYIASFSFAPTKGTQRYASMQGGNTNPF